MTSSIPGQAVDGALRLARFPADQLLKVAPETGATTAVGLVIDRADAAIRSAAGSALSDHGLRDDAGRRRAAVRERERAMQKKADKSTAAAEKRKVDRLEQLEKKSDALEVKDAAVRAADEARRLDETAAATKEKRKASSGGAK